MKPRSGKWFLAHTIQMTWIYEWEISLVTGDLRCGRLRIQGVYTLLIGSKLSVQRGVCVGLGSSGYGGYSSSEDTRSENQCEWLWYEWASVWWMTRRTKWKEVKLRLESSQASGYCSRGGAEVSVCRCWYLRNAVKVASKNKLWVGSSESTARRVKVSMAFTGSDVQSLKRRMFIAFKAGGERVYYKV